MQNNEPNGRCVFFGNEIGESVILLTCSFNCSSMYSGSEDSSNNNNEQESTGQFAYLKTKKNEVNESTIAGTKKKENTCPNFALYLH